MHDDWFPLAELTRRVGGLAWVEARLGTLLAGWAGDDDHAGAARAFFGAGRRHAEHALALQQWLPTSPALDAAAAFAAPTGGWEATLDALTAVDGSRTVVRLDALSSVIDPWVEREIGALVACTDPVSESSLHRRLRFVLLDHADDATALRELAAGLRGPAAVLADRQFVSSLDLG